MVFTHNKARYEGDGDPGCFSSCQACYVEKLSAYARSLWLSLDNLLQSGKISEEEVSVACGLPLERFRRVMHYFLDMNDA